MEKNRELVRRIQQGEDVFEEFVRKNEGLVYGIVHRVFNEKYCKGFIEYEDACNLALYYTYKAILDFDLSKNLSVSTYLTPCVYYGILGSFYRKKKRKEKYQFVSIDDETSEETRSWHERLGESDFDGYYHLLVELEDLVEKFPIEEQQLFFLYYLEGQSQQEIGDELGMTQVQVSRLLKKIRHKLKRHYHQGGI